WPVRAAGHLAGDRPADGHYGADPGGGEARGVAERRLLLFGRLVAVPRAPLSSSAAVTELEVVASWGETADAVDAPVICQAAARPEREWEGVVLTASGNCQHADRGERLARVIADDTGDGPTWPQGRVNT